MEFRVPIITKVYDRRGSCMEKAPPLPKIHAQKVDIATRMPTFLCHLKKSNKVNQSFLQHSKCVSLRYLNLVGWSSISSMSNSDWPNLLLVGVERERESLGPSKCINGSIDEVLFEDDIAIISNRFQESSCTVVLLTYDLWRSHEDSQCKF